MKIYLDNPIYIDGKEINHTEEGLKFLIQHYEGMLQFSSVNRLTGPVRTLEVENFMKDIIEDYKINLELYKNQTK